MKSLPCRKGIDSGYDPDYNGAMKNGRGEKMRR